MDTGSSGNGTQREMRLRANYMQSEYESNCQLREENSNGSLLAFLIPPSTVKSCWCSASPATVLRTGYHDEASGLSTLESGIYFRNSARRYLHIVSA